MALYSSPLVLSSVAKLRSKGRKEKGEAGNEGDGEEGRGEQGRSPTSTIVKSPLWTTCIPLLSLGSIPPLLPIPASC